MCFSPGLSLTFAAVAFTAAAFIRFETHFKLAGVGVFYFGLMELLQFFQYRYIDECDSMVNKVLTMLGFLHICFQPFFTHLLAYPPGDASKDSKRRAKRRAYSQFVLKLTFAAGLFLASRAVFGLLGWFIYDNTEGMLHGYDEYGDFLGAHTACGPSTDWLRGNELCTFSGRYHLGWSVPMASNSYFIPGSFTHMFAMFIPFYLSPIWHDVIVGSILFLTGPVLSYLITDDNQERASIWCFFSIAQIVLMVFTSVVWVRVDGHKKRVKKPSEE